MPVYKYIFNRILTLVQNIIMGAKLSEYHTGYRAYTRKVLEGISWRENSNDFVFDNQFLSQAIYADFRIGEITCPTKYFKEASSINFSRSVKYGLGCLSTAMVFRLNKMGFMKSKLFKIQFDGYFIFNILLHWVKDQRQTPMEYLPTKNIKVLQSYYSKLQYGCE